MTHLSISSNMTSSYTYRSRLDAKHSHSAPRRRSEQTCLELRAGKYLYIYLLQMHSCGYCQQTFAKKSKLMEHHRLNKHHTTFTCGVCQKRFTRKDNLDRNERKHNNDSFFPCSGCRLLYRRKDNLYHHLKEKHQIGAG
jgi:uncharacterized Zn-finger protein